MRPGLRFLAVILLMLSLLAGVVGWLAFAKVKKENRTLTTRLQLAGKVDEFQPLEDESGNDELAKLRRESREIFALRGEVSQLRNLKVESERLRSENQRLHALISAEQDRAQEQWLSYISGVRTNGVVKLEDIPYLVQALTNEATSVRLEATKALRNIGLEQFLATNLTAQAEMDLRIAANAAVPNLLIALMDADVMVRANAAITLGFLREHSEVTVPALVQALNDAENRVALSASKALSRLKSPAAIPALLLAARSANPERREAAIHALKQTDPEAVRQAGLE